MSMALSPKLKIITLASITLAAVSVNVAFAKAPKADAPPVHKPGDATTLRPDGTAGGTHVHVDPNAPAPIAPPRSGQAVTGEGVRAGSSPAVRRSFGKSVSSELATKLEKAGITKLPEGLTPDFYDRLGTLNTEQFDAFVDLVARRKAQVGDQKLDEVVDAEALVKDLATISGEGLGKVETANLVALRSALDADLEVKSDADAIMKKSLADVKSEMDQIKANLLKSKGAEDPEVAAKINAKFADAYALLEASRANPGDAELASKAREAMEEIVALKRDKYKEICGVGGCPCS